LRALAAEEVLQDQRLDPELFRRAADAAMRLVDPPADIHASSGYRRQLTGVLVRRALAVAAARVKGSV
jgi:CO/xanthine dehydrogenase FAD-binding subunit